MTSERLSLVSLSEGDIEKAGALLARAFQDNPLLVHMSPGSDDRRRISPSFFSAFVRLGYLAGEVFTTPNVEGVAVWFPPGVVDLDPDLMARAGVTELASAIGEEPLARIMPLFGKFEALRKRDASFPHWYLSLIGVDPEHQGKGVAGSLLRPQLTHADSEGLPCYLETCEPSNVSFYQKYGFVVVVDETDTESGVQMWTFLRPPSAA